MKQAKQQFQFAQGRFKSSPAKRAAAAAKRDALKARFAIVEARIAELRHSNDVLLAAARAVTLGQSPEALTALRDAVADCDEVVSLIQERAQLRREIPEAQAGARYYQFHAGRALNGPLSMFHVVGEGDSRTAALDDAKAKTR